MKLLSIALFATLLCFCNKPEEKKAPSLVTKSESPKKEIEQKNEELPSSFSAETYEKYLIKKSEYSREDWAKSYAIGLVEERLKAPATAQFHLPKIIEKELDQYLVHVIVDAQNTYGALIRSSYCVTLRIPLESDQYFYYKNTAVVECPNPPKESDIDHLKGLNYWNTELRIKEAELIENTLKKEEFTNTMRTKAKGRLLIITCPKCETQQHLKSVADTFKKNESLPILFQSGFMEISIRNENAEEESINLKKLLKKE